MLFPNSEDCWEPISPLNKLWLLFCWDFSYTFGRIVGFYAYCFLSSYFEVYTLFWFVFCPCCWTDCYYFLFTVTTFLYPSPGFLSYYESTFLAYYCLLLSCLACYYLSCLACYYLSCLACYYFLFLICYLYLIMICYFYTILDLLSSRCLFSSSSMYIKF